MSAWKVEIRSGRGGHRVALVVGAQSFTLVGVVDAEGAEWMAAQLRHAIVAIERGVLMQAERELLDREEFWRGGLGSTEGLHPEACADEAADCAAIVRDLITSRLPSCSGCEPGSEGTHSEGTRQHP